MTISMGTANLEEINMCTALLQQIVEGRAIEVAHKSCPGDLGYRWEFRSIEPYSQIGGPLQLSASGIIRLRGMSEEEMVAFFRLELEEIGVIR